MKPSMLLTSLMISNEAEDMSGRTSAEVERVLYARLADFEFLKGSNGADHQEQWSVKVPKTDENAGSGSIRVRKSINLREPSAPIQYVLATKLDIGNRGSSAETPEPSTSDQFKIFKYMGNKGMIKDRYYFDIPNSDLKWEVDCFPKEGGLYHEWVKIDLEKWPRGKALPQLPMDTLEIIDGSPGYLSDENKAKVSELYETIFLTKNELQPLMDYSEEESPEAAMDNGDNADDSGAKDEEGQNKANDKQGNNDGTANDGTDAGGDQSAGDGQAGAGGDGNDDDQKQPDGTGPAGDDDNDDDQQQS